MISQLEVRRGGMSKFSHFAQTMSDKWLESWESSKLMGFSKLLVIDVWIAAILFLGAHLLVDFAT